MPALSFVEVGANVQQMEIRSYIVQRVCLRHSSFTALYGRHCTSEGLQLILRQLRMAILVFFNYRSEIWVFRQTLGKTNTASHTIVKFSFI